MRRFVRRSVLGSLLAVAACGGSPSPSTPSSNVLQSGTIADAQAAKDIVLWNMLAAGGAAYRRSDMICRWELPVPVYIQEGSDVDRARVIAALDYWATTAGVTYTLKNDPTLPRVLIRFGTDGLADWGGGRSTVDGTNPNNSAKSGLIVYEPDGGQYCAATAPALRCLMLYRHEIGHVHGIFINTDVGGLMGSAAVLSDREVNFFRVLYSLPFGARVSGDGTWQVVAQ